MTGVHLGGLATVTLMYALFLFIGWKAARKSREGSIADWMLAGRTMPLWLATLTMTATWVDGGYLLGTAQGASKSLAEALQPGICFGISLILGGLLFSTRLRQLEYATLIDPFEARFGRRWAAVLGLPALFGEIFWSAELLVAIGATFQVILGLDERTAILFSAGVVTLYTVAGGMWSVAYTDAFQLGLIPLGLVAALCFAFQQPGGLSASLHEYSLAKGDAAGLLPVFGEEGGYWTNPRTIHWWDLSVMLVLGGIPWNCYFQRVLSCASPRSAAWHSILAGLLTMVLTLPPLLLGIAAATHLWPEPLRAELAAKSDLALPYLLRYVTPYVIGILGLVAIVGAVTSSFSSSILSAGSMISWNFYRKVLRPNASLAQMKTVSRSSVLILGVAATLMALRVRSVLDLWIFTSDLVFVLLFPQLLWTLYDRQSNRIGSITAFMVSLVLRLGGGEPTFGIPPLIPYDEIFRSWLPPTAHGWYDATSGEQLFPFRTAAALAGLILLPVVSRLTARLDPPRPLRKLADG